MAESTTPVSLLSADSHSATQPISAMASAIRARTTTRKRSRSSVELFNVPTLSYDTKRARIGIQNLSTEPTPQSHRLADPYHPALLPIPSSLSRSSSSGSLESQSLSGDRHNLTGVANSTSQEVAAANGRAPSLDHDGIISSSLSSSDEDSDDSAEILGDEEYDSDSESGSTTTSSSSSSSSSGSSDGDSEDQDEELEEGDYSSRSATFPFPSPEQIKPSYNHAFDFSSGFAATKPPLTAASMASAQTLTKRLHSLLPQLAAANAQLDDERAQGTLAARDIEGIAEDEERYIEMNLGLGVLEEKKHEELSIASASVGSDNDGDESDAGSADNPRPARSRRVKKHDVMAALMGRKQGIRKSAIQVVDGQD